MKKRFMALFLALVMCLVLVPTAALAADDDFIIENGMLTKYNGPGGAVIIPNGVTCIGEFAFSGCTGLTSVIIPNSVTEIWIGAFEGCTGLTSVTIPDSVTVIATSAFDGTPWLKSLGDLPVVNGILLCYQGSGGHVTIPNGVTDIGRAFSGCTSLTSVTIPNGVTFIGDGAFAGCTSLTSVNIPNSVTSIGGFSPMGGAFGGCTSLTSVTIPSSVTSIGFCAFAGCTSLTSVTIPDSVTVIDSGAFDGTPWQKSLGDLAVVNGTLLRYQGSGGHVTIPDGVTTIGWNAFFYCENLTSVTIPNSVTRIEDTNVAQPGGAFSCTGLTSVTIPGSVASIGCHAFSGCIGLTSVTILSGVTSIEPNAFCGCTGLTSVTIPNSVTKIGMATFEGTNLKDIYYGGSEAQWKAIENFEDGDSPLFSATIHYNSTMPTPAKPTKDVAHASTQNVLVDGKAVEFQAYALKDASGNDTNYVKLRDVAYALSGTAAQFSVGWDQAAKSISVTGGGFYKANGSEMKTPYSGNRAYTVSSSPLYINGKAADLEAILLTDDAGNGYTYFKLRDLGEALGFTVDWSAEKGIFIETK